MFELHKKCELGIDQQSDWNYRKYYIVLNNEFKTAIKFSTKMKMYGSRFDMPQWDFW